MPVDWTTLHKVLRDETRKKIVLHLRNAGSLTYTDLMNRVEITNTGTLNYHLKKLNDLVSKDEQGSYRLNERGVTAAELLEKFPSQIPGSRSLRAFDAMLIGLLGLLLVFLPILPLLFFGSFLSPIPDGSQAVLGQVIQLGLILLCFLVVPAYVMRRLTIRRINSHDLYDLVKPPVAGAAVFYLIVLVIYLVNVIRSALAFQPSTSINNSQQTMIAFSLFAFVLLPAIPILGVLLIEAIYRLGNR